MSDLAKREKEFRDKHPLAWLVKASRPAVMAWLARELPTGSKLEAIAKLGQLQQQLETELPAAELAIGTIASIRRVIDEDLDDGRPWLEPPGDLLHATVAAWETIIGWASATDRRRFLARFGDAIVRLEVSDNGALGTTPLDVRRVVNLLARVARWARGVELLREVAELLAPLVGLTVDELLSAVLRSSPPPVLVAQNLLADPEPGLPLLERVTEVPVIAPDGSIHDSAGYDPTSRCFYAPAARLDVPRVSAAPADYEVAEARALLLELVCDFPFVGAAECAHAVAFLVEPFVRVLIDGSTPLYLFEAPTPGTGKSLLVEALAAATLGPRKLPLMAEARDPDEWRKRLTAKLRNAPSFLVIDNLRRPLDAGALAMMITAGEVEDRLLGVSETITLPVRCTLAATANNPTLSDELTRRVARVRLDTGMEAPEEREGFLHADLLGWARAERGRLIWAALTLARAWVAEGRPAGPERPLGSFEQWTRVLGGILHVAGIEGMLTNLKELRAESRDTTHGDLLRAVHERFADDEFTSAEIAEIARPILGLGDVRNDATATQRIGTRLKEMVDRPVGGLVLRRGVYSSTGVRKWRVLTAVSGRPPAPPAPPADLAPDSALAWGTGGAGGDPALDGRADAARIREPEETG